MSVTDGNVVAGTRGPSAELLVNKKNTEEYLYHHLMLMTGDKIYLEAHTSKFIHVQGFQPSLPDSVPGTVHAYWRHDGEWETFTIERTQSGGGLLYSGDEVTLKTFFGTYLAMNDGKVGTVEADSPVEARTFMLRQDAPAGLRKE